MYWSDWGERAIIEVAGMDGTERRTIVDSGLKWPNGLAIDFESKKLYWADGGTSKIECSEFDGSKRTTVVSAREYIKFNLKKKSNCCEISNFLEKCFQRILNIPLVWTSTRTNYIGRIGILWEFIVPIETPVKM